MKHVDEDVDAIERGMSEHVIMLVCKGINCLQCTYGTVYQ